MKCHTEGRRVRRDIKASTVSYGGTVGVWSDGDSLLILLAIYIQSVHIKGFIRNLYATPPSLFVHRHLRDIVFTSVHSVTLCAILFERLSLSVYLTGGTNIIRLKDSIQKTGLPS